MSFLRNWATPLIIGAFLISSITGIAMFFHLDRGYSKSAHEWLGWLLVVAAVLHVVLNGKAFARYFTRNGAIALIVLLVGVAAMSFAIPRPPRAERPNMGKIADALAGSSIEAVAAVAKQEPAALAGHLRDKGFTVGAESETLAEVAANSKKQNNDVIRAVFE